MVNLNNDKRPYFRSTLHFQIWAILAILLLSGERYSLRAQEFPWRYLGLEEGLPTTAVEDILTGPAGYTWLATEGAGLVRYDGYLFRSYFADAQPLISHLHRDSAAIWTLGNRRLGHYNGRRFKTYPVPGEQRLLDWAWPDTGGVWLLGGSGAVYRWQQGKTAQAFQAPAGTQVLHWHRGHLYLAGQQGLFRRQKGGLGQRLRRPLTQLAGEAHLRGLGPAGFYPHLEKDTAAIWTERRYEGLRTEQGEVLLWKASELLRWKGADTLCHREADRRIEGAHLTPEGVLVLQTAEGLAIRQSEAQRFWATPARVQAVARYQGRQAIGTPEGLFWQRTGRWQPAERDLGIVFSMAVWRGALWLGTEQGLWRYQGGRYQAVAGPRLGFVFSLQADSAGLLLGTGAGLFRYQPRQGPPRPVAAELPSVTVFKLQRAPDGSLWAGTYTAGLWRRHKGRWQRFQRLGGLALDSFRFSSFYPLNAQQIWLGTQNKGLYKLGVEGSLKHLSYAQVGYAAVNQMTASQGPIEDIWLGTNKGVLALSEVSRHKPQNASDALTFLGAGSVTGGLEGGPQRLWAGTDQGLYTWDLPRYLRPDAPPRARLQGVDLLMNAEAPLKGYAQDTGAFSHLPEGLKLPHDRNYVVLRYGAEGLLRPGELRYRYRLVGQSGQWTVAGQRREAIFPNLTPGKYRFEVQARRPGRPWEGAVARYTFEVKSPFYVTWWFISLVLLLAGGLVYGAVRQRVRRLQRRLQLENQLMETERKALRLQMNPHFIFNALDSISSFIFKKEPKQAVRYLNNFAKLMRGTLESSMAHLHPVETEVSILKNYLELEKLRFGAKFDFQIVVAPQIDYNVSLPPMLVQPHVENAILHGLKPKREKGHLLIRFDLLDEQLRITVEDNGIGREAARQRGKRQDHRSRATQINKDRIDLLRRSMGRQVHLHVEDLYEEGQPSGTRVVLELPTDGLEDE